MHSNAVSRGAQASASVVRLPMQALYNDKESKKGIVQREELLQVMDDLALPLLERMDKVRPAMCASADLLPSLQHAPNSLPWSALLRSCAVHTVHCAKCPPQCMPLLQVHASALAAHKTPPVHAPAPGACLCPCSAQQSPHACP